MFIPRWLLVLLGLLVATLAGWTWLLATGRNPLPVPDPGSRIFGTPSPQAKEAVVALLARHGLKERFEANSTGILRSIMWDGTIINYSPPEVLDKLGHASASIGLVADDPVASAQEAAEFLRARGFQARVVLDAEPAIPIAFVVTDATLGTVISFRKHLLQMPRDQLVRK
jgi:hypothetical protein